MNALVLAHLYAARFRTDQDRATPDAFRMLDCILRARAVAQLPAWR